MSTAATPRLKLKKQYAVNEVQSSQELTEHLNRHSKMDYEFVQVLPNPNGKGFVVILNKEVPITAL